MIPTRAFAMRAASRWRSRPLEFRRMANHFPSLLFAVLVAAANLARAKEITLFVSPQGNDEWSGEKPAPVADGKNGPLATLSAAIRTERFARKNDPTATISIFLRGGFYEL